VEETLRIRLRVKDFPCSHKGEPDRSDRDTHA
jgi:hypothetical protein